MTQRTKPLTLILLAIVAAVLTWIIESLVVQSGLAMLVPPVTLPITLVVVSVVLLVLAWPVRAYTRAMRKRRDRMRERGGRGDGPDAPGSDSEGRDGGRSGADGRDGDRGRDRDRDRDGAEPPKRVDPLLAVRVLAFAKASSMAGSVIGGAMLAVTIYVATRPVVSESLLPVAIAGAAGAVVLLVAGLVAESWCALPPDDRSAAGSNTGAAPTRPVLGA
ncbi:MAG: DUF3180 domain-containing protein [Pseudoclavibacter sp.]